MVRDWKLDYAIDITSFVLIRHIERQQWRSGCTCRSSATMETKFSEYFKTLDSKAQSSYKQQLDMLGGIPDPYQFVPLTIDYLNYGRVV